MKRISFSQERCWTVLNFQKCVQALQISSSANRRSLNKRKMLLTKRSESQSLEVHVYLLLKQIVKCLDITFFHSLPGFSFSLQLPSSCVSI